MGQWQTGDLAGLDDIVYVIAMHENKERQEPTPANLERWQDELGFTGDIMLLDYGREIIDSYIEANPDAGTWSEAVTVVIDKNMRIRRVGSTYDTNHQVNLDLLLELSDQ